MSDERLRELERRWKETGTAEDEAAFLLERVRVGELTQERLELAAVLGHEAALRAVSPSEKPSHSTWTRGLALLTSPQQRLLACDLAERVLPIFDRVAKGDQRPRSAIAASRGFAQGAISEEALASAVEGAQHACEVPQSAVEDHSDAAQAAAEAAVAAGRGDAKGAAGLAFEAGTARDWPVEKAWQWQQLARYVLGFGRA